MRRSIWILAVLCGAMLVSPAAAQPGPRGKSDPGKERSSEGGVSSIITRMMAFDKEKTGKLTKEMVTDSRLHRLFDLADANKDGFVTKEELTALAERLAAENQGGGRGQKGPDGPDGGRGPKGFDGPFGRGPNGPPQPGQVMPVFLQNALNLSTDQKKQLEELQRDVDSRLGKILTDDQKKQLQEMRSRGPGGGFGRPDVDGKRPGPGRTPKKDD